MPLSEYVDPLEDDDAGLELAVCGNPHPMKPGVRCTLPPDHGPVMVGTLPFGHYDANREVAWRPSS